MNISYEKIKKFEDEKGWKFIHSSNEKIGKSLDFQPRVEYAVCDNDGCCYNPASLKEYYPTEQSQKDECERYLREQKERFPDGWVSKGDYKTTKLEFYPQFHTDFNYLIEAVERLQKKGVTIVISTDIFKTWEKVLSNL